MKHAYLTCELKSRDLDSRILIAIRLLERGLSVVIGQQWSIFSNAGSMPPGAVLFKTANKFQTTQVLKVKSAGHKVVLMDEEVLALKSAYNIMLITDPTAVANCDIFLFQDEAHGEIVRAAFPGVRGKIAGNSRVDLIQTLPNLYRDEAVAFRKPGPYILINTNFTLTNSVWGGVERALTVAANGGAIEVKTERGRAFAQSWIDTEQQSYLATREIIAWMTQNITTHRLVVRPHPAEQAKNWQAIAGIEVVAGMNPLPWILGADLTIHPNSTTGLEAVLLGCPCLNLCPAPDTENANLYVMREANYTATSLTEATHAVESFIKHGNGPLRTFKNPVRFEGNASNIIADEIAALSPDSAEILSWQAVQLEGTKREKFAISLDAFAGRVTAICGALDVKLPGITALDDSLFYLKPEIRL